MFILFNIVLAIAAKIKFDAQIIRHFGAQRSFELTATLVFETKPYVFKQMGFNIGIGDGVSYLARPSLMIDGFRQTKPRRTLNFMLAECNIYFSGIKNITLTFQWHHRCTLFNTIAPNKTGSNFFAIGVRYYFSSVN